MVSRPERRLSSPPLPQVRRELRRSSNPHCRNIPERADREMMRRVRETSEAKVVTPVLGRGLRVFALAWTLALVFLTASAHADGGANISPGPCNVINVFNDTDEMQDDIFDNFNVFPNVVIQWIRADDVYTLFKHEVNTGDINCETTGSHNEIRITAEHTAEPPEPIIVHGGIASLRPRRVGTVSDLAGRAAAQIVAGGRYRMRVALFAGRHQVGRSRALDFDVRCRIQTSEGCV
jgi:hypothetical protein